MIKDLSSEKVIGLHVTYSDFLGFERYGTIVAVEPITNPVPGEEDCMWIYIEDEDQEYNIHQLLTPAGIVWYCELRISNQVILDDEI